MSEKLCMNCKKYEPEAKHPGFGECAWLVTLWNNTHSLVRGDMNCSDNYEQQQEGRENNAG